MAFRTLFIESRCKLEYSLNYLIYRKGLEEKKILLDEIKLIVICSTQVSITSCLISELSKKKIKCIFCDEKFNPECEMVSYQNNYYSFRKIKEQLSFSEINKNILWQSIVKQKIINQTNNIDKEIYKVQYKMMLDFANEVELGDVTNREGHSAKVYFNTLFGKNFKRSMETDINKFLNYGYTIILSLINREIKSLGYLTEIGIYHIGESNAFNLSCDFMEPLRPLVDKLVLNKKINNENFKIEFINMLSLTVKYNEMKLYLDNAIHLYVEDLINYLKTGNLEYIKFIDYEF